MKRRIRTFTSVQRRVVTSPIAAIVGGISRFVETGTNNGIKAETGMGLVCA